MRLNQIQPVEAYPVVDREKGRCNFAYIVFVALIVSVLLVVFVVVKVPPSSVSLVVVLFLIGFLVNAIVALILYKFSKPRGYESEKQVFRRQYIKGLLVGLAAVFLLSLQKILDIV